MLFLNYSPGQMTLIKPNSEEHSRGILSNLTENVSKRLGFKFIPYTSAAIRDLSGNVHWMYVFDEHESRMYRVQNGSQHFVDLDLGDDKLIDLDDLATQIKSAIETLILKDYR